MKLCQTSKFYHQASFVIKLNVFAFSLFVRGYSFQLQCLGNSFMQSFATLTHVQTEAATSNIVAVLAVVCKRVQQLPTRLGPAVHRGKDTTHKTLETMCNERVWPHQFWK